MNMIYSEKKENVQKLLSETKNQASVHLVEINGKEIKTWKDYISVIERTFMLPTLYENNMDSYLDWMTDLDWLGKDSYILVIYDYKKFLKKDVALKAKIMDCFRDVILPWWQEEVEQFVVEGRAKPFNVYTVD